MINESIYSCAALHNRLTVSGILVAQTALRIGAGRAADTIASDLPVIRDARGCPFIPGASLKGAFRARIETLIRTICPEQARDLDEIEAWQRECIAPLKQDHDGDRALSVAIWNHSTLIDLTFGAPWLASRIFFKDAIVDPTIWFGQFEMRNGVAINRDTETAHPGLLYDYEVIPIGTRFHFHLVMENAADWQLGMVLIALRAWEQGTIQIGGFRSRGLGYVALENADYQFHTIRPGNIDDIIAMLGADHQAAAPTDEQRQSWNDHFRAALQAPKDIIKRGVETNV